MKQNCKLWVPSILAKIQNFEGFFKQCLIGDYVWSKLQQDWAIFGGVRATKTLKRVILWMLNQYKKLLNFAATNAILIKFTTDMYLNKVFHLAKSWGVTHEVHKQKTFLAQFWPFLNTSINSVAYLMHHLAYHHLSWNHPRVA